MAIDGKKVATGAASGAAMGTAIMPGWGTAIGAVGGGLLGLMGGDDNEAPAPAASQYGGNPLTSQLAAQQYAEGLQQQQGQNAREAAFYNQANGNFDIGNAAQLRQGPQIQGSAVDQQRQLIALGQTNTGIGNLNKTGNLLTSMGTAPMGPSYAEAQLRQGQDAAMAQQLSMARSGRSLGSGQAAMQQAAFNNAALNQQTNMGAADARIREQQNYNQFQLGALQGAGNAYNGAGGLAGQAGNQATTIRSGNEGIQAQNAALQQSQQQVNNQTTGLYNQLGAQQQGLGMQANQMGQNAFQFGANQAANAQTNQLNADVGRLSATTATNVANQNNANAHDAATVNAIASGAGAVADSFANNNAPAATNPNNPSGSTSQYQNITTASNNAGKSGMFGMPSGSGDTSSDERQKTNIKALSNPGSVRVPSIGASAPAVDTRPPALTAAKPVQAPAGKAVGETAGQAVGAAPPPPVSYAETIAALNSGYRPSQFAPTDVLNHVAGAGAGHSASQDAVIAQMMKAPGVAQGTGNRVAHAALLAPRDYAMGPAMSGSQLSALGHAGAMGKSNAAPEQEFGSIGRFPSQKAGLGQMSATAPEQASPPAWGDVFNQPQLDPRIQAYLNGASPYPVAAPAAAPKYGSGYSVPQDSGWRSQVGLETYAGNDDDWMSKIWNTPKVSSDIRGKTDIVASDAHSKTRIQQLETQLAALSADSPPTASFAPQQPDTASLDQAYAREQNAPAVDLRPAQGYEYSYKDPHAPGATPGRQVGPMAQDLLATAARGAVHNSPSGLKVDTPRLTMVNTAALSEQQRKTQELEQQLAALQAPQAPAYRASLYPQPGAF